MDGMERCEIPEGRELPVEGRHMHVRTPRSATGGLDCEGGGRWMDGYGCASSTHPPPHSTTLHLSFLPPVNPSILQFPSPSI